jgi:DNA-binding CsgD family transcriptional regulator
VSAVSTTSLKPDSQRSVGSTALTSLGALDRRLEPTQLPGVRQMVSDRLPQLPMAENEWNRLNSSLQLTPRQARVAELILRNQCDKQIAALMGLGVPTICDHKSALFRKLRVSDRIEFILQIFRLSHPRDDSIDRVQRKTVEVRNSFRAETLTQSAGRKSNKS